MKIETTIDGKRTTLNVNSNKPLNLILMEEVAIASFNSTCGKSSCGNCVVMVDDEAVLSCLTPAFKLINAQIVTFEGFRKSRFWHDIERAYEDTQIRPCPHCYQAKSLIFESLLRFPTQLLTTEEAQGHLEDETVINELSLNSCYCLDPQDIVAIYRAALEYRRRRRVRRN